MVTIRKPSKDTIQCVLQKQSGIGFSYPEVHFTEKDEAVPGYNNDHNRVLLGSGQAVYDAACEAIRTWQMFPGDWAWIEPPGAPIQAGQALVMVARVFGLHWLNACRIVYILDGSGPVRSYADVIAAGPNADEIVLIEGSSFTPNQADQITALRLVWDEAANTLRETPVPVMAALVVGDFATAEAARAQYADACFANYWLLRADQVGEKSKRFVLALLTPDAAVPAFNALPDCSPKAMRRVAQFRPNNEKK